MNKWCQTQTGSVSRDLGDGRAGTGPGLVGCGSRAWSELVLARAENLPVVLTVGSSSLGLGAYLQLGTQLQQLPLLLFIERLLSLQF